MRLETKRLVIRNPKLIDAKDIAKNINNLNVSQYMLVVPYPYKLKDAINWIKGLKRKRKEEIRFVIELKENKEVIGGISLHHINKFQGTCDIGYWLGERYWRQGIMSEVAEKIIDFGFSKLKLRRIEVSAYAPNIASNSLIKKLGFKYEGTKIKSKKVASTGKIYDENIYGLLKEDWKNF